MTADVGTLLLAVYVAGVIVGLLLMPEGLLERLVLAALWPVGPLAFILVVSFLFAVAMVVWWRLGLAVLALAALIAWLLA